MKDVMELRTLIAQHELAVRVVNSQFRAAACTRRKATAGHDSLA